MSSVALYVVETTLVGGFDSFRAHHVTHHPIPNVAAQMESRGLRVFFRHHRTQRILGPPFEAAGGKRHRALHRHWGEHTVQAFWSRNDLQFWRVSRRHNRIVRTEAFLGTSAASPPLSFGVKNYNAAGEILTRNTVFCARPYQRTVQASGRCSRGGGQWHRLPRGILATKTGFAN